MSEPRHDEEGVSLKSQLCMECQSLSGVSLHAEGWSSAEYQTLNASIWEGCLVWGIRDKHCKENGRRGQPRKMVESVHTEERFHTLGESDTGVRIR